MQARYRQIVQKDVAIAAAPDGRPIFAELIDPTMVLVGTHLERANTSRWPGSAWITASALPIRLLIKRRSASRLRAAPRAAARRLRNRRWSRVRSRVRRQ